MLKDKEGTPGGAAEIDTTKVDESKETPKEKTLEEINEEVAGGKGKEKDEAGQEKVGLDKYLDEKTKRKDAEKKAQDAEKALADLRSTIEGGANRAEINATIASLGAEYDIKPEFLQKLATAIKSETEKSLDDKYAPKLSAIEKKERDAKIDAAFTQHFNLAMAKMPDLKDMVNPSVIKTLSLDPSNSKKTITQIIEEVYGSSVPGKRTVEKTIPGGGKDPAPLDFQRARKDREYFKEVMANPTLKKEYNTRMLSEI